MEYNKAIQSTEAIHLPKDYFKMINEHARLLELYNACQRIKITKESGTTFSQHLAIKQRFKLAMKACEGIE